MWTSLMGSLPLLKSGRSVSVNWENRTGAKGAACQASSALGKSRKGSPCIPSIAAGETVTLAELTGSGAIQHIWCTVTDATPKGRFVLRDLVLRMYWDGEETPSVECPLGDFFLNGFARGCSVNSLPVAVNPNRGMNCFLPMPFASHAKITLENQHAGDIPGFFYQVDAVLTDSIPENAARFHAQWRREKITQLKRDYVLLDNVRGRGHYIGTYLGISALERYWWGEGEMKFYIDGDGKYPTWCSTGAEDYFGGAWSFAEFDEHGRMHERTFTGPYLGFPFYSQNLAGRESAYWDTATPVTRGLYRWHIPDPIYFERDLRVEWQQIGTEEAGNFERQDDVATVAYWYQSEPHKPFAPIGDRAFRRPR